ncbi:MAG: hypothetical protein ABW189_07610 [Rickettsiales bacterium]
MPQLEIYTYPGQVFWLAVSFLALYFCMTQYILPKLRSILQQRDFRRESDVQKATEFKREAESILREYEAELAEARAEASKLVESSRAKSIKEVAAKEAAANAELQSRIESEQEKAKRRQQEGMKENAALRDELAGYIMDKVASEAKAARAA